MPSTINTDGAWTLQSMDTALIGRLHDSAFLAQVGASGLVSARPGVIPSVAFSASAVPADLFVQALGSPAMAVQVLSGAGVIPRSGQGPYLALNTTTQGPLTIAASNPTNPRIDLVYWQILDHAFSDAGSPALGGYAQLGVVTGTPSGTPAVPALPSNAIPLAQVAVAANATQIVQGNITQVRKSAAPAGANRILLEGDLLTDPGFVMGEERCRYHVTYGTLVDRWDSVAQLWRGTNTLELAQPTQTGSGSNAAGTTGVIGSLAITDPGWPYHIVTGGSFEWTNSSGAAVASIDTFARVQVDSTTAGTNQISLGYRENTTASTGTGYVSSCATKSSKTIQAAGYTGVHTVYLLVTTVGSGPSNIVASSPAYQFFLELVPA